MKPEAVVGYMIAIIVMVAIVVQGSRMSQQFANAVVERQQAAAAALSAQ
jgi:hypothetical protein